MNLNYRLLWFDDNREFFESLNLSSLYATIKSWGFELSVDFVETPEEFMRHAPFSAFDLMAVDYNLALDDKHGGNFVKGVRDHGTFTEVIFYSNNPAQQLWEAIREQQLEGVFIANRQGLIEKIERVGQQAVKKVLDVNNMRGLVMAEVGELDHAMDSIIRKGLATLSEEARKEIFDAFHEKAIKNAATHNDRLDAFKNTPDADAMIALCDSNKRWECFNRLKKRISDLKTQLVGDFPNDVLLPRNFLAHGIPEIIEGGYRFSYMGKTFDFSEKVGVALRQTILSYKQRFGELSDLIPEPGTPKKSA